MKRKLSIIVAVAALMAGFGLLLYPHASNYYNQYVQSQVADRHDEFVSATSDVMLDVEREAAVAYNEALLENMTVITDPFDPRYEAPNEDDYERVLNLGGDGVMGTLFIPAIELRLPIYHGTSSSTLEKGVGHLERTSVPIGGASTHMVLSGHTGLPSMVVFDKLNRLEAGDYFIVRVLDEDHAYRVTDTEIVLPEETDSLKIVGGADLATLVTCTPYGVNSHRLLVHAERADVPQEWLDGQAGVSFGPHVAQEALLPFALIGIAIACGIALGWLTMRRLHTAGRSA